jgi:uncharacterized protein involved in outer membrane biogenesis
MKTVYFHNFAKAFITSQIEKQTQLKVEIGNLDIAILQPTLKITDLILKQPRIGKKEAVEVFKVKMIKVVLRPFQLIIGKINIKEVTFDEPFFHLNYIDKIVGKKTKRVLFPKRKFVPSLQTLIQFKFELIQIKNGKTAHQK